MSDQSPDLLHQAMQELRPVLAEVTRLMAACPLPGDQRKGLCVLVLGHFAGVAMAELGLEPTPESAVEIGEIIAAALRRGAH